MTSEPDPRLAELVTWLNGRGHSPDEIDKILARVAEYDAQTINESIFDSLDAGEFDLSRLIDEALGRQ